MSQGAIFLFKEGGHLSLRHLSMRARVTYCESFNGKNSYGNIDGWQLS